MMGGTNWALVGPNGLPRISLMLNRKHRTFAIFNHEWDDGEGRDQFVNLSVDDIDQMIDRMLKIKAEM